MEANNFFCHLPFVSINTNGVTARPCCAFQSVMPVLNYENNEILQKVKQELFHGRPVKECEKCYANEAKSGKSFRTLANEFHPHLTNEVLSHNETYSSIKHVDIVGSNICNLKCLPCEHGSYIRTKELYDLGLQKTMPIVSNNLDIESLLHFDIRQLTLCSGEPFYVKDIWNLLTELKSRNKSKQIELHINTNLTNVTTDKLDFLLDNFKSVLIKGSIDGVGPVNDYLRYPSLWTTIEKTVELILDRPEIQFVVTTALSNLALLKYHELVSWCQDRSIKDLFISQVGTPSVLGSVNLPRFLKDSLKSNFDNLKKFNNFTDRTLYCLDLCTTLCDSQHDFNQMELMHYLDLHDQHRGTDWKTVFPELLHNS
jgi:hypothetical protein